MSGVLVRPDDFVNLPTPIAEFRAWAGRNHHAGPAPRLTGSLVYFAATAGGDPLYIGITSDLAHRMRRHGNGSPWVRDAGWMGHIRVSTTDVSRAFECWLIAVYQPSANVRHRDGSRKLSVPTAATLADLEALGAIQKSFKDFARTAKDQS